MKAYPEYKDSGIDWFGDIPAHWGVYKLKRLTKFIYGNSLSQDNRVDGPIPVFGSNGIVGSHTQAITKSPCIVIGRKGSYGKINYSSVECFPIDTTYFIDEDATTNHIRWIYYLLLSLRLDAYSKDSAVPGLSREDAYERRTVFPPLPEQRAIADFLDRKTAQIDMLIAKKQRQKELLQEHRTALINQAVTKGLNPDVSMKESGIEWLGEVPAHWVVMPLKYIKAQEPNALVDGPFGSNLKTIHFVDDGDVYVIDSGFVTSGEFVPGKHKTITLDHFKTIDRSACKAGDIIIAKIGARFGTSGILPELGKPCVVSGNSLKLKVDTDKNSIEYIHFQLLNLKRSSGAFDLIVNTTAQPALSMSRMNDLKMAAPPKYEQNAIVEYINNRMKKIKRAERKVSHHIELLKEYRTALISAFVTGKIDVRGSL